MSKYQNKTTNEVVSYTALRKLLPNIIFRNTTEQVGDWNRITQVGKPQDTATHKAVKGPVVNAIETWDMVAYTEDELAKLLQEAKDAKITDIDTQTGIDIELVVGDSVAQRNMLAEYLYMLDAGQDITAYKAKWEQVALLRTNGNVKEAQVQSCTTIDEVKEI